MKGLEITWNLPPNDLKSTRIALKSNRIDWNQPGLTEIYQNWPEIEKKWPEIYEMTWNQSEIIWNQPELTEIYQNWSDIYQKWPEIEMK